MFQESTVSSIVQQTFCSDCLLDEQQVVSLDDFIQHIFYVSIIRRFLLNQITFT